MSAQSKSGLNEADQKELQSFLETKQAEARIQSTIHDHTDRCWDKCIKSAPGTSFARGEEACLANCVDRFLDTSIFIVNKVYSKAQQAGA